MTAAMIHALTPVVRPVDGAVVVAVVVDARGEVVVVVVLAEAGAADVEKATTRFDEGANRRFAPMDGVGKWFAGAPIVACSATDPDDGLRP